MNKATQVTDIFSKDQIINSSLIGKTIVTRVWATPSTQETVTARVIDWAHGKFQVTWQERHGFFWLKTCKCTAWISQTDILTVTS